MGGNTRAINRDTGETIAIADKVDLRQIRRLALRRDVIHLMDAINYLFSKFSHDDDHQSLWDKYKIHELLDLGKAFNGTSEHIFGMNSVTQFKIPVHDLVRYKPIIGDIDVTVPREKLEKLFHMLAMHEHLSITKRFRYLGQNKQNQHGHQINTLFEYYPQYYPCSTTERSAINIQIDFEGVKYVDGMPDEFSKFAHSSSWEDVKIGIKGVAHKYWLTNVVRSVSEWPEITVLTEKSPAPPDHRVKKMNGFPRKYAFSVDRGLREKLTPVPEKTGFFKELKPSESNYTTDLKEIFQKIFGHRPVQEEFENFGSFVGLNKLCKNYLTETKIKKAYQYLLEENLYGYGAQKLSRTSAYEDHAVKKKITDELKEQFPYLCNEPSEEQLFRTFYENY